MVKITAKSYYYKNHLRNFVPFCPKEMVLLFFNGNEKNEIKFSVVSCYYKKSLMFKKKKSNKQKHFVFVLVFSICTGRSNFQITQL